MPTALCGPEHRSRRVPPTAPLCGGFGVFTSGGARAPRPDGEGPPGRRLDSMSYPRSGPCGRLLGPPASCARASPGPLLARLGVLPWEAVFPSPAVHRRLAAPCVPPVFLSLLVTWPAWCVLSRFKLSLSVAEYSRLTLPARERQDPLQDHCAITEVKFCLCRENTRVVGSARGLPDIIRVFWRGAQ